MWPYSHSFIKLVWILICYMNLKPNCFLIIIIILLLLIIYANSSNTKNSNSAMVSEDTDIMELIVTICCRRNATCQWQADSAMWKHSNCPQPELKKFKILSSPISCDIMISLGPVLYWLTISYRLYHWLSCEKKSFVRCIVNINSPYCVYLAICLVEESCYLINPAQLWHLSSWLISLPLW